jgi:glycosyltransferase involved in cell wall biosynthesis
MKVLCLSVTPSPYQRDFFKALAVAPGCELTVVYYEVSPDDSPWQVEGLEPWESVMSGRVFGRGRVRCHWNSGLPNVRRFDRVIVNAPITAITTQRLFRRLVRRGAPPWYFWGEQLLPRTGARGALQRLLIDPIGGADAIVAIGNSAEQDYRRRFPESRVYNIPYACDLSEFEAAAASRVNAGMCRFLFVGQMIERKGVDVLLKAFENLVQEGRGIELHLVGREGDLPEWLASLQSDTRAQIVYHGFRQPNELPKLFGQADVFVLPSRHDGWGVVVNQALGAGMPVITTTAAGAGRDLVTDCVNGMHVPPNDVGALTAAMRSLVSNQGLRNSMSMAALAGAENLGPAAAARNWFSVLQES